MSRLVHRETLRLFPTLVGCFELDDPPRLAGLADEILARARVAPTVARGERTGWQSGNDLLDWSPSARALGGLFGDAVTAMAPAPPPDGVYLAAWANVLRRGDYFTPHAHPDAAWSGVLYVDAGDSGEAHGGFLSFRDPRAGAGMVEAASNRFDASTMHHYPRTGALVVFPAWLVHWVVPYQGERPRISVAFNAR
ncbi:MAG TPA: TIGR02466 family protein [Kofleriaceae bacterium]|nr:TIGR02466 family protein [Kofleriaceae bacterium]